MKYTSGRKNIVMFFIYLSIARAFVYACVRWTCGKQQCISDNIELENGNLLISWRTFANSKQSFYFRLLHNIHNIKKAVISWQFWMPRRKYYSQKKIAHFRTTDGFLMLQRFQSDILKYFVSYFNVFRKIKIKLF